jgi:hypothetical protein
MAKQTITIHKYSTDENSVASYIGSEEVEVEVATEEELIAEKEEQLLKIYEELQSLKKQ